MSKKRHDKANRKAFAPTCVSRRVILLSALALLDIACGTVYVIHRESIVHAGRPENQTLRSTTHSRHPGTSRGSVTKSGIRAVRTCQRGVHVGYLRSRASTHAGRSSRKGGSNALWARKCSRCLTAVPRHSILPRQFRSSAEFSCALESHFRAYEQGGTRSILSRTPRLFPSSSCRNALARFDHVS